MHQILSILEVLQIQPVLFDVGASGRSPPVWRPIGRRAVYVGFDPDQRELREINTCDFGRAVIVNRAVVADPAQDTARFYLTRAANCSSSLPPDHAALNQFLFADMFTVVQTVDVAATTLAAVAAQLDLPAIDWLKIDSQGTDLRIFNSLPPERRTRVLALDIEPGLADAYQGEDLFVVAHQDLLKQGFWLSRLAVKGAVRMRPASRAAITTRRSGMLRSLVAQGVRPTPVWCEARYLRTIPALEQTPATPREYVLLWAFALLDEQPGFALEVAQAYVQAFGTDAVAAALLQIPLQVMQRGQATAVWLQFRRLVERIVRRLRNW